MPQDIRQIIPANGWVAVYIQDTPLYYFLEPLVCWALVHHAKTSLDVVEGFLTGEAYTGERYVEPAESSRNFYRYAYAPEITDADREYWTAGGQRGAQIVQ